MMISDPPLPYATISSALSISVGSIGSQRARCLARLLRRSPALAAFSDRLLEDAEGHGRAPANEMGGGRGA